MIFQAMITNLVLALLVLVLAAGQAVAAEGGQSRNVDGNELALCGDNPATGFYRSGYCHTGAQDIGTHVACAVVTDEFLQFTKSKGNDLITPRPESRFPGLKAGDKWCLCASRWAEAQQAGVAPKLVLAATEEKMLKYADRAKLQEYAVSDASKPEPQMSMAGAHQFAFKHITGEAMPLSDYKGKVILVVNTASECGFSAQYRGLETLYQTYKDRGLVVIGVPCNQFGGQEPGSDATIRDHVKREYGVTFPLTAKSSISGAEAHPFFEWAAAQGKGGLMSSQPKWNFHKYLVGRDGQLIGSYSTGTAPDSIVIRQDIEKALHTGE